MINFLPSAGIKPLFVGAMLGTGMLMGSMTNAATYEDSKYIYGIHDTGGEYLFGANGGWTTHTEYIGMDKTGGKDYTQSNISNVVTLNYGHYYNQIPGNMAAADGHFPLRGEEMSNMALYAERVADYISNSEGVNYWVIGDEFNKARTWAGNSTNNTYTGEKVRAAEYAASYNLIYDAVKAVAPDAKLVPAASSSFAPPLSWDGIGSFVDYWSDCLTEIGADRIDGLAFKAFSHNADVSNITDESKMGGEYYKYYYNFQVYKNFMEAIPEDMKHLPAMITEIHQEVGSANYMTNPRTAWKNDDNGWIEAMYAEVDLWNQENDQQIICAALHRWNKVPDDVWTFGISDLTELHKDIEDAVGEEYQWRSIPEPASLMLLGLGGLALLRRRA